MYADVGIWTEVRRRVLTGELSKRAACRQYGINWRTLVKRLAHVEPPVYQWKAKREQPVLGAYVSWIHEVLEQDEQGASGSGYPKRHSPPAMAIVSPRRRPSPSPPVPGLRRAAGDVRLSHPQERALALELLRFGEALEDVEADYRPTLLSSWLYDLAGCYSTLYDSLSMLKAEGAERDSRLALCDLTGRLLRQGLELLGIGTVEKM